MTEPRIVFDREGRIALVNERAQHLLGFSEQELLGRGSEELVTPEQRSEHVRARASFLAEPSHDAGPLTPGLSSVLTRTGQILSVILEPRPLLADEQLWVSLTLRV